MSSVKLCGRRQHAMLLHSQQYICAQWPLISALSVPVCMSLSVSLSVCVCVWNNYSVTDNKSYDYIRNSATQCDRAQLTCDNTASCFMSLQYRIHIDADFWAALDANAPREKNVSYWARYLLLAVVLLDCRSWLMQWLCIEINNNNYRLNNMRLDHWLN